MRRAAAILARIGYFLSRYKFLFMPLDTLALALLLFFPFYIGWYGWRRSFQWSHGLGIVACLLLLPALAFVRTKRYTFFEPGDFQPSGEEKPLRAEEKISCRGTGYFEVSGMRRRFIEIPALFWTTELHDHIITGRVNVVQIPFLTSPIEERGMWYIFISPRDVLSVATGSLYFGLSCRPAIRLGYREPSGVESSAYLSFDSRESLIRLQQELTTRSKRLSESR